MIDKKVFDTLSSVINPTHHEAADTSLRYVVDKYKESNRKWHSLDYLWLGIKEYERIMGSIPMRDTMTAWAYHYFELGDESASAMEMLRNAKHLNYGFEDAERYVLPQILRSSPAKESSSIIGDMRILILGQKSNTYRAYVKKLRQEFEYLNDNSWKLGRLLALKQIIGRKTIFYRPEFNTALEVNARENILAELEGWGYTPPVFHPKSLEIVDETLPDSVMTITPTIVLGDAPPEEAPKSE